MNSIFHYYAVKFLALRGGFSESDSEIIAYSCQLVDRSLIPIVVDIGGKEKFIISQTHHFGFWDPAQAEAVWQPFHFFPSGNTGLSNRKDRREDPLVVTPNSLPVKELLISALKSRNLYRIGIALHTYADSWAHQNFIGMNSGFNRIENFSPIPAAGHAQIGRTPDIWSSDWIDIRLQDEYQLCSNQERFFAAAEKTYKYLATFNKRPFDDWELIKYELMDAICDNVPEMGNSFPRKNSVMPDHQLEIEFRLLLENEELDESAWFTSALPELEGKGFWRRGNTDRFVVAEHEIRKLLNMSELPPRSCDSSFYDTNIYKWAVSAEDHKSEAKRIMKKI